MKRFNQKYGKIWKYSITLNEVPMKNMFENSILNNIYSNKFCVELVNCQMKYLKVQSDIVQETKYSLYMYSFNYYYLN